jgi:hypothetical protein
MILDCFRTEAAEDLMHWIEPTVGDPLPHHYVWRQSGEFIEQLDRADRKVASEGARLVVRSGHVTCLGIEIHQDKEGEVGRIVSPPALWITSGQSSAGEDIYDFKLISARATSDQKPLAVSIDQQNCGVPVQTTRIKSATL